jgi:hypothetical protein
MKIMVSAKMDLIKPFYLWLAAGWHSTRLKRSPPYLRIADTYLDCWERSFHCTPTLIRR